MFRLAAVFSNFISFFSFLPLVQEIQGQPSENIIMFENIFKRNPKAFSPFKRHKYYLFFL